MTTTPLLAMPYLVSSQAQKELTHNDALNDLDFLTQTCVASQGLGTPPVAPASGDTYIIGPSATGGWAGFEGRIASYFSGWRLKMPRVGWRVFSAADGKLLYYTGSGWGNLASPFSDVTFSWTPGTLTNGAGVTSAAVTVSGAVFGDFVQIAAPYSLQGVLVSGYVSAANTVMIRLHNATGSSIALVAGIWRVRVFKQ